MNHITKTNLPVLRREIYVTVITILTIHIFPYSSYILQQILYEPEALLKIQWDKCIVTSQLSKKCNIRMRVIVNIYTNTVNNQIVRIVYSISPNTNNRRRIRTWRRPDYRP